MGDGYYKGMNYKETTYYQDKYFTFPIEVFRMLLDKPEEKFRDVLCWQIADATGEHQERLIKDYYLTESDRQRGEELKRIGCYCGVNFSLSVKMFDKYYCTLPHRGETDLLELLAYLALKSLGGNYKIVLCDSEKLLIRMSGYVGKDSLLSAGENEVGRIKYYMQTERRARETVRKLRLVLMEDFKEFHTYSCTHKRGFAYMFSNGKREHCMRQMAELMESRTQRYKESKYGAMMRDATRAAKVKMNSG